VENIELIATCAFGLESTVKLELQQLGYTDLTVRNGGVTFKAGIDAICRANLWLRTADRILIKAGEFPARTFSELFENTRSLPWEQWLPQNAQFPVEGKSVKSQLFSVPDCQAIVKKAIVEKLKTKYHCQWFEETGAKYRIQVSLLKDIAELTIDTSGAGLHKRGYRSLTAAAPLKETLAAALIIISRWKPDRAFIDPCCGSGTIPIEAALIGRNIAPGLKRTFVSENWPQFNNKSWSTARQEAHDLINREQPLGIMGFDIDPQVLSLARYHSEQAGLKGEINFQQQDVKDLKSKYHYGYLITNPPYGERLSERKEVENLYKNLARSMLNLPTWSFYIITSYDKLEKLIKRKADKKRKLYNGRIECTYYQFFGPKPEKLTGPFALPQTASTQA